MNDVDVLPRAPGLSVLDRISDWATTRPDSIALQCAGERMTYGEMWRRVRALERWMSRRGTRPGWHVAVAMQPGIDAVVAALAGLCSTGCYVPVDVDPFTERSRWVLQETRPVLVLTDAVETVSLASGPSQEGVVWRYADALDEAVRAFSAADATPPEAADARRAAYVIYTSGSTGTPKGVVVTHRGLSRLAAAQIEAFDLGPEDCVLAFANSTFDASISELLTTLVAGATLRIATKAEKVPGAALEAVLVDGVTTVTLPPSLLGEMDPSRFPGLRTVVSAGEACSDGVVARWSAGRRFINAYGPTEATVCATMKLAEPGGAGSTIGTAIPGATAYVLDPEGAPVDVGEQGELYIGGDGVARGYLNRPGATAASFVPDPFCDAPGARMYKSGDVVRRLDGGEFEFVGRLDRQVEILGHRVEPREVERVLLQAEGVEHAVVVARQAGTADAKLVAFVVAATSTEQRDPAELSAWLAEQIPPWLVPSRFVSVDHIPLTERGKIDTEALWALAQDEGARREPAEARTDVERILVEMWRETLGLDVVGLDDDFFALGGQSVLAVRLIAQIEELWGRVVPVSALVEGGTISRLAEAIHDAHELEERASPIIKIKDEGDDGPPLLLCHAIGGSALCYLDLIRELSDDASAWGLESPAVVGMEPPSTIPELGAVLARIVMDERAGPYRVAGWSFGGLVAFELALALEREGETVESVFLLDPGSPRAIGEDRSDLPSMVGGFAERTGLAFDEHAVAALPPRDQVDAIRTQLEAAMPPATAAALLRELRTTATNIAARQGFEPSGILRADIDLFVAREPAPGELAPDPLDEGRWAALTNGALRVTGVASSHEGVLHEPHVSSIVESIERRLEAEEEHR